MGIPVHLVAPKALLSRQPPLVGDELGEALVAYGEDLIPSVALTLMPAPEPADLVFDFRSNPNASSQRNHWHVSGTHGAGVISYSQAPSNSWSGGDHIGAGVAAVLCAAEAFKHGMRRVATESGARPSVEEILMASFVASFSFGEVSAVSTEAKRIGNTDVVSGGAITTSMVHALLRSGAQGHLRVIEPEKVDASNLNRYPLTTRADIGQLKSGLLSRYSSQDLEIVNEPSRLDLNSIQRLGPFAPTVVVGADDIPCRWLVQGLKPARLFVGSTADFLTLTSEHPTGSACARCLHPVDDGVRGVIGTVSFVSYFAGLALAWRQLSTAGRPWSEDHQALLAWPLRMDLETSHSWQRVTRDPECEYCGTVHPT
jgi:hypothetical protein